MEREERINDREKSKLERREWRTNYLDQQVGKNVEDKREKPGKISNCMGLLYNTTI